MANSLNEVGLSGEIRAVPQIDKRLTEAVKLGFKYAVILEFAAKSKITTDYGRDFDADVHTRGNLVNNTILVLNK